MTISSCLLRPSSEQHATWRGFIARHERFLDEHRARIYGGYRDGFARMALPRDRVPTLGELDARLEPTGWRTCWIDGYASGDEYKSLLSRRVFPIAAEIRRPEHLEFSPVPDALHDIVGHLPLLFDVSFRDYLESYASAARGVHESPLDRELHAANVGLSRLVAAGADEDSRRAAQARVDAALSALATTPSEHARLSRLYLWSVEFGLIGSLERPQIYGGGLLSSHKDALAAMRGEPILEAFSSAVAGVDIRISEPQPRLFVAGSFAALKEHLAAAREILAA